MKGDSAVFNRFQQYRGRLHVSVATLAELWTWVLRATAPEPRAQALADLLSDVSVLDATPNVSRRFGEVEAGLLDRGQPVSEFDLLIAATALVHNLTLVTHNVRDFADISGLTIRDWLGQ